jgi:poly-gamma-glutamate capsule biosynthesis protein CapA/YwtB (metallophosphatase superfamily)
MKQVSRPGIMQFAMAIAVTALVAGCANAPLRTEASTSGISAAEEAGAVNVPQAALHLQLAKEELAAARVMSENGEKEKAASMLLRAEADAELAVALSHQDAERSEAIAAVERVRQLRRENQ